MKKIRLFSILLAAALFPAACTDRPGSGNTPREMFEAVVLSPVPPGISGIEGTGDTMGGYNLFIRFTADAKARALVLERYRYRRVECGSLGFPMRLSPSYDRFREGWDPGAIGKPECYDAEGTSNGWSKSGHHRLMIDPGSGTVYFAGIGI